MEYIATYHTDVGTRKETNQDSLAIKVVNTKEGNVAFAIVCRKRRGCQQRGNRSILYMV